MNRILALFSTSLLLAASAAAQCVGAAGTAIGVGDDTTFVPHFPLGFSMPVAGSALGSYTHFRTNPNGWIILTNGTTTPAGTPTGYGSSTVLAGLTAGYAPRIAPFWKDMTVIAPGSVSYDNTTNAGVSCRILFKDTRDYNTLPTKSYEAELYATGNIVFRYTGLNVTTAGLAWVGVSRGNAQPTVATSNLSTAGGSAGVGMVYETFATGTFDLGSQAITISPDGGGGWNWALSECANHSSYNKGCYSVPNSVAQSFADAAVASAAMQGNAVTFVNTGTSYVATWIPGGAAGYQVPGGGATTLAANDDGSTTIVPSVPLNTPSGPSASVTIEHNGNIIAAATNNQNGDYTPTTAELAGAATALSRGFYSWHDFNNAEVGSGPIQWEELTVGPDQILYVTWNGVENYSSPVVLNPSTIQHQVNLTTGTVTTLWVTVDTNITSTFGSAHVVGYTSPGLGNDPGSVNLSAAAVNVPEVAQLPLTLSAAPAPTFVLLGSSVPITYTTSNLQDLSPVFPGVYLAAMAFSINNLPPGPGFDLTFIGLDAPGCDLNVSTIDVYYPISPVAATHNEVIVVPQPLSPGDTFYVQSVCFFIPNQLPNGQNNVGIISSNGIRSYFQTF